ncbi:MAG: BtrH N-terminal domain-containing protein [Epulopiscium sp.]|nr:BtrH N-terminal domain-containing protein [Candidatus Epulonipiscium sp.]
MKLISTYQHIDKREILDCRVKSIKELIRHYNVHLNSYEILLISKAITFNYDRICIPGVINHPIPYGTVSHNTIEKTFFDSLCISYKEEKIESTEEGWKKIKSMIDRDIPVMFRMDSRFLMPGANGAERDKKINLHYLSTLLLVGYDEEENKAFIVLTNTDEKEEVSVISIDAFQKYRSTTCFPFAPDSLCYYVTKEDRKMNLDETLIQRKVLQGLKETIYTMLNEDSTSMISYDGFVGTGMIKGIKGMEKLKDDLKQIVECYDAQDRMSCQYTQFSMAFLRNNMMFGSYSGFRYELSQCLQYCAEHFQIGELNRISNEFKSISNEWKKLFMVLSSIAHNKGNRKEQLNNVIKILERIIKKEEQQYMKINQCLYG